MIIFPIVIIACLLIISILLFTRKCPKQCQAPMSYVNGRCYYIYLEKVNHQIAYILPYSVLSNAISHVEQLLSNTLHVSATHNGSREHRKCRRVAGPNEVGQGVGSTRRQLPMDSRKSLLRIATSSVGGLHLGLSLHQRHFESHLLQMVARRADQYDNYNGGWGEELPATATRAWRTLYGDCQLLLTGLSDLWAGTERYLRWGLKGRSIGNTSLIYFRSFIEANMIN